jgi:hypothetical protein
MPRREYLSADFIADAINRRFNPDSAIGSSVERTA